MFIGLFLNLVMGLGFSLLGRERIRIDGPFAPPAFRLILLFAGIIVTPMTLYLHLAHPSWTWMYAVEPESIPSLMLVPVLVAHAGALLLGWLIGARLVTTRKTKIATYGFVVGVVLTLVVALLLWGRLGRYGTLEEFRSGRALGLMEVKLGYVLIAMVLGGLSAAVLVGLQLSRDSRRATSR